MVDKADVTAYDAMSVALAEALDASIVTHHHHNLLDVGNLRQPRSRAADRFIAPFKTSGAAQRCRILDSAPEFAIRGPQDSVQIYAGSTPPREPRFSGRRGTELTDGAPQSSRR